jgi:hypothetical protein
MSVLWSSLSYQVSHESSRAGRQKIAELGIIGGKRLTL